LAREDFALNPEFSRIISTEFSTDSPFALRIFSASVEQLALTSKAPENEALEMN